MRPAPDELPLEESGIPQLSVLEVHGFHPEP